MPSPIPMLTRPKRVAFFPRNSLHTKQAFRTLQRRRGAGDATTQDAVTDQTDIMGQGLYQDPIANTDGITPSGGGSGGGGGSANSATLPNPNPSVYGATQVVVSTPSGVNLRSQPSATASIIKGEPSGTILQVLGQKNGWLNVQDPQGAVGWVYSANVSDASQGQGTLPAPDGTAIMSSVPLGAPAAAGGLVGLGVVAGVVVAAYYLLVK